MNFGLPQPVIFVEKDGALLDDIPFNVDPQKLRFIDGALEALAALAQSGYALVIVATESGLGRRYFSRGEFARLQQVLEQRLLDEAGISLHDFMVCPHAPNSPGLPACGCCKPAPGLLTQAAREHCFDLPGSWMVGKTADAVEAGYRAGCRSAHLQLGTRSGWRAAPQRRPDAACNSWADVLHAVLGEQAVDHRSDFSDCLAFGPRAETSLADMDRAA